MARRDRGAGSIHKIEGKANTWRIMADFGVNPATGKRERPSKVVHGTKSEARKALEKMISDHEAGLLAFGGKTPFRDVCDQFIEAKRSAGKVKESTLASYSQQLAFMCEFIGSTPIEKVNVRAIECLFAAMRKRRKAEGASFGGTTQHAYFVTLKAVMSKAVRYDLILRNPCDRMDAPKKDRSDRKPLSRKETARLMARLEACEREAAANASRIAEDRRNRLYRVSGERIAGVSEQSRLLLVAFLLATGARLGEGVRLRWEDVSFSEGTATIRESKTEAGCRTVALDARTLARLREWRERQADLLRGLSSDLESEYVFCSCTGTAINISNVEAWWRRWREANGFDGLRLHELRHTQATQLLAHGVDVKTVQARLGHASAGTTLNFYAHSVRENDRKAADLFGRMASGDYGRGRIIEIRTA